jgi:hypothetical protein
MHGLVYAKSLGIRSVYCCYRFKDAANENLSAQVDISLVHLIFAVFQATHFGLIDHRSSTAERPIIHTLICYANAIGKSGR